MTCIHSFRMFALLLLAFGDTAFTRADEVPTDLLARYVNNETIVIGTAHAKPELLAQLHGLIETQMTTPVDRTMMKRLKPLVQAWGERRLFFIASASDLMPASNGPLLIATAAPGEDAASLEAFGERLKTELLQGAQVRMVDGKALLIVNRAGLDRFDAIKPQPRPELVDKLAELVKGDAAVAAVLAPGPDARRVLREMWPQLPPPYNAVTGPLLADRVRQITFTAQVPPEWSAEIAIHTSDDATASTLAKTGAQVVQQFAALLQNQMPMPGIDWPAMIETATPKQHGDAVVLTVSHDNPAIVKAVASLAAKAVGDAREAAQRSLRMNQFKNLALAFHNYHDSQKAFPSAAPIRDKDGKPLLSWRVAILPYLGTEENELFNQFHFDEPWDSKHNLTLLSKMPAIYADPARPDHGGNTTYLLPVHSESAFVPLDDATAGELSKSTLNGRDLFIQPGFSYRSITDGTSVTIMVVETASERAVPWTKPGDWEIDLANPIEGLKQEGRDGFVCALCDGSARFVPFSIDPKELRALLTRAGKEIIDWSFR